MKDRYNEIITANVINEMHCLEWNDTVFETVPDGYTFSGSWTQWEAEAGKFSFKKSRSGASLDNFYGEYFYNNKRILHKCNNSMTRHCEIDTWTCELEIAKKAFPAEFASWHFEAKEIIATEKREAFLKTKNEIMGLFACFGLPCAEQIFDSKIKWVREFAFVSDFQITKNEIKKFLDLLYASNCNSNFVFNNTVLKVWDTKEFVEKMQALSYPRKLELVKLLDIIGDNL